MKGRSCLPNDAKIFTCICFGAFWIVDEMLSYGRITSHFRIIAFAHTRWLFSYYQLRSTSKLNLPKLRVVFQSTSFNSATFQFVISAPYFKTATASVFIAFILLLPFSLDLSISLTLRLYSFAN